MGRRSYKKVTVNGEVTLHQRYIYRGYLQIACCDLTRSNHPCLWLIMWDSTQPIATRPLAIQKDGTWYTYGLDLTKNVCEVFGTTGYIATTYTYSPYGEVTANGSVEQPIQWSSEFLDKETELVYYNYRYYNPLINTWNSRDLILSKNLYIYINNSPNIFIDRLGLKFIYDRYYDMSIEEIYKKRGAFLYTGTRLTEIERKKLPGVFQQRWGKLGIIMKKYITKTNNCYYAPQFDMEIITLYPKEIFFFSNKGIIDVILHEHHRAIVYQRIYDNYIEKINNIRCPYVNTSDAIFTDFIKHVLLEVDQLIVAYAQSELGDGSRPRKGIDADNSIAVLEHKKNGSRIGITSFTIKADKDISVLHDYFFDGFDGKLYMPKHPKSYTPPPCPEF